MKWCIQMWDSSIVDYVIGRLNVKAIWNSMNWRIPMREISRVKFVLIQLFKHPGARSRHEEEHLRVKNFNCVKCGKGFLRYEHALSHEKICRKNDVDASGCCIDDGKLNLFDIEVCDDEQMEVKDTDGYTYL